MFREISVWHVVLILVAFMVLFGYKKLPDATRSLGRSMRIFKSEMKGLHDDEPKQVGTGDAAAPSVSSQQATSATDAGRPAAEVPGRPDTDRA